MTKTPVVSVVLGSYNRHAFLKAALESVRANGMDFPYEIIVVDGGSTDASLAYLMRQKDVITIIQHNRGSFRGKPIERQSWGYFMNLGFKIAHGKYILMISDDCLLVPDALKNGVTLFENCLAENRPMGAIAFYWRSWPEQIKYHVNLTLGDKMFVNHGLYLRSALEKVGWIDEDRYRFYHADGDLCLRLWERGFEVIDSPTSFVEHFTHSNRKARSENQISQQQDWKAYLGRWINIYYDPVKNNIGTRVYCDHTDALQTVTSFPFSARLTVKLVSIWQRIWNGFAALMTGKRI